MAGPINKGTYLEGLSWAAKRWVAFLSVTCQNLKILDGGFDWGHSHTQEAPNGCHIASPDGLITTIPSVGYVLGQLLVGVGIGVEATLAHTWQAWGRSREPPVTQVQLTGQAGGHVFVMTLPTRTVWSWIHDLTLQFKCPTFFTFKVKIMLSALEGTVEGITWDNTGKVTSTHYHLH